jgi:hydrogenase maturation factor
MCLGIPAKVVQIDESSPYKRKIKSIQKAKPNPYK